MLIGLMMALVALARSDQDALLAALGVLGIGSVPATSYNMGRSKVKAAQSDAQARFAEAVADAR